MRRAFAAVVVVLALAAGAAPAQGVEPLQHRELRRVVKTLLREYIAPAVTDDGSAASELRLSRCRVTSATTGSCRGSVTAGGVTCRGVFKVRKEAKMHWAWPVRMTCEATR